MAKIKDNPTVSVVILTYNRAHLVGRAIQSVLDQTYQDFEIVIVDDASTDNTEEVVKSFNDGRLRYIRHKENSGGAAAPKNTGIKAARGEYIAFLSDDDEWLPHMLEKQTNKFRCVSSDVGVVYSGHASFSTESGKKVAERMPIERGHVFELMLEKLILGDLTPLVRKECFRRVGVFDTQFLSCEWWDMLIRISKYYKFDFVPEILCKYYIHSEQGTASLERRIEGLDRLTRKYQNYLPKTLISNRFRRLGSLCCYQGDFRKASRYFREAINNNPRDIYTYPRFLLSKFAPKLYEVGLRILKSLSTRRAKLDKVIV